MKGLPIAIRSAGSLPSGPGRKLKTREQWESEGFTYERVLNASRSKSKTEAANLLSLHKNNRYILVEKIYKAFGIHPHYSKQDTFARINVDYTKPEEIIKQAQRECNNKEFSTCSN